MIAGILSAGEADMQKSIAHTERLLGRLRAGKADSAMLEGLKVTAYGAETPLTALAGITVPDARTIQVKVWDKALIPDIEKTIAKSALGLTPQLQGDVLRISIPPLSEERRMALVKEARQQVEQGRASLRTIRHDLNDQMKRQKDELGKDALHQALDQVQRLTDQYVKQLDNLLTVKEKEITTI